MAEVFLFVLWAGGGNVPPQLVMARRLAARGHEVRVLAPAVLRAQIEAAGLVFEPYQAVPEHDESAAGTSLIRDFEHRTPIGAAAATRENLLAGLAGPVAADVGRIVAARHIDAVVTDYFLLGSLFAAEAAGIPTAMLIHTVYPFPAPLRPPFGMGWMPGSGPGGMVRDAVGRWLFRRVYEAPLIPRLNVVRGRLGLRPIRSLSDMIERVDRVLVLTSDAFDFPGELPGNVRYVGAQLEDPDRSPLWQPPWPSTDRRPVVAVGLSTTYQRHERLLRAVVDALAGLDVNAIVPTGGIDVDPTSPNIHTAPWIPHQRAFALADVVVTHAGLGTVHAALAAGRPMVCLPIGRDQPENAARVAWHGAGVRLGWRSSPATIRDAVGRVLREPRFAGAAGRLGAAMALDEASTTGTEALMTLPAARSRGS